MKQIINLLRQNWFKISLTIVIISIIFLLGILFSRNNGADPLAEKLRFCETNCIYNTYNSTWDFSGENVNRNFLTKDACFGFCITRNMPYKK